MASDCISTSAWLPSSIKQFTSKRSRFSLIPDMGARHFEPPHLSRGTAESSQQHRVGRVSLLGASTGSGTLHLRTGAKLRNNKIIIGHRAFSHLRLENARGIAHAVSDRTPSNRCQPKSATPSTRQIPAHAPTCPHAGHTRPPTFAAKQPLQSPQTRFHAAMAAFLHSAGAEGVRRRRGRDSTTDRCCRGRGLRQRRWLAPRG